MAVALIIVAFSKNAKQASSISPIVAVPLSFIAGAFIPLPDCVIATINNQQIQIIEILPWNQAITAIRQVLTYVRSGCNIHEPNNYINNGNYIISYKCSIVQ